MPTLTDKLGNTHVPDRDKASALNAYFASMFTSGNGFLPTFVNKSG